MEEKFLPIGSIVKLKGQDKKAMIIGFCGLKDRVYDYYGCFYPRGIGSFEDVTVFDHEDIEKIIYLGFTNEEEALYKSKLNALISDIGSINE